MTRDKRAGLDEAVGLVASGMTIGIGGWGSRRKPMALVRALCRSPVEDLTLVSYGGPDVGLLCAAGKVRRVVFGFVSLDTIALEPGFRAARQEGRIQATELDEGMLGWGLLAAAHRLPFLPTRAGLGSDVLRVNPELAMVKSPYADQEELVAMPALHLDIALVHAHRADPHGASALLGPDPYFDDLFCAAATRAILSCERVVDTADLAAEGGLAALRIPRHLVHAVVEAPRGAHFTSCEPDYPRDEGFQREYAAAAAESDRWRRFHAAFLSGDEAAYQRAVAAR